MKLRMAREQTTELDVTDFEATVMCMDWVGFTDGGLYKGFHGRVTILSAKEAVGFEPTGHNSANWFARVAGETTTVNLMGCQVRAVVQGSAPTHRDFLTVP
jgi:hypothetical protein